MGQRRWGILLVTAQLFEREALARHLRQVYGYEVDAAASMAEAMEAVGPAQADFYEVVVMDEELATAADGKLEQLGLVHLKAIKAHHPETEVILLSSQEGDRQLRLQALRAGATHYLSKPLDVEEIGLLTQLAVERCDVVRKAYQATRQAESQSHHLKAIQKISTTITSLLEFDKIFEATCRAAVELFEVDHSGLVRFQPDYVVGQVVAEYPDKGTRDVIIPVRSIPVEEHLITKKEPLAVPNVGNEPSLGQVREIFEQFDIRSILIAPVVSKERVLGSFSLDTIGRSRTFGAEEIELCKLFAGQVASALENAEILAEVKRQNDQLERLSQITLAITSERDRDKLLGQIVQQVVVLLKAKSGGIYEYSAERGELQIIADHRRPKNVVGNILKVGEGLAGRLIQSGEPYLVVRDYNQWSDRAAIYADERLFGAVIEVPLRWQKDVIGVLYVDDEVGREFTKADAGLLQLFADTAAIALVNADLAARDEAKLNRLERLSQASSRINGNLGTISLTARLDLIAQYATEILNAEACAIFLVRQTGWLSLEASFGHRPGCFEKGRMFAIQSGPHTGLTGHIACEGKLFNVYGADLSTHFAAKKGPYHGPSADHYSILAIPLKRQTEQGEELLGLLRADNKKDSQGQPGPLVKFGLEDEWILNLFADAVVTAIEGAALVAELSDQKAHWERLVASSPEGIIAVDGQGRVSGFNGQAERILKYTAAEILDQPVDILYADPREARQVGRQLYRAPDGKLANYETFVRSKEGERIPICLAAAWIYNAHGKQVGSVGYFEDLRITKATERRLELLLKASNTVAQAANLIDGLQRLAEMMVTFLDLSFCRSFLLDASQQYLVTQAVYPRSVPDSQQGDQPELEAVITIADWPELTGVLTEKTPRLLSLAQEQHRSFLIEGLDQLGWEQQVQSLLLIPLRAGDKIVGLLWLGEVRLGAVASFSDEKQELALAIADQTALFIDRARSYETTERHRRLLDALDKASRHIRAEKETFKLLQEVVRLAAQLVDCTAGGLYLNYPQLRELELYVTYGLPSVLVGGRLPHHEGVVGLVAQTGERQIIYGYNHWEDREDIFEAYGFQTVIGLPLKQAGEVEAVLFLADDTGQRQFSPADLDILERFAGQASIALQTSQIIDREQRKLRPLTILHQVSDYIQAARDLDRTLHVALTGITAGYGLGFNRAAIFLLNERQEYLEGRMGVGYLAEGPAWEDWARHHQQKLEDFGRYLQLLEQGGLPTTPIQEAITGLRLPVAATETDLFSQAVLVKAHKLVQPPELDNLPQPFTAAFEPALPFIIVPLLARGQAIGLLVADNKFTQASITPEDIESLLTFANTIAVAIDNLRLFAQTKAAQEKLRSFYEASNALVSSRHPEQVLHDIVEQGRLAARASGASVFLIDHIGQAQYLMTTGSDRQVEIEGLIRPNGLSMMVMRTGRPEIIEDTHAERDRVNPSVYWRNVRAALCLPVAVEGKRIGVIWLHYDQPRRFSDAEIEALQLYVNQAALAYDSAWRITELHHLHQAAKVLASVAEPEEVLRQIVWNACEILRADSASVSAYEATQNKLTLKGSVAIGLARGVWSQFCETGVWHSQVDAEVMAQGWLGVEDVANVQQYPFVEGWLHSFYQAAGVRSFQGISLTVEEEKLGVLYVNYDRPCHFGEDERNLAQTFANHAALTLKKAKFLDQVSKARNAAHIVARVTALENLDSALHSVVDGIGEVVDCDVVTLYIYDQRREKLSHPPTMKGVDYPEKASRFQEIPSGSLVFEILKRDKPYITTDTSSDNLFKHRRFTTEEQIKSLIAIPLIASNEKVGVMFVNYRQLHHFTADELISIELFANQAAVAIRNAQLYEQVKRRAGALRALYDASRMVAGSLDLQDILRHIVEQAPRVTKYQDQQIRFACLRLVEDQKSWVEATYPSEKLSSARTACGGEIDLKIGKHGRIGIMGRAAVTGIPQIVGDVLSDKDYLRCNPETRSELAVPIKLDDRVEGVINVEHDDYNAFDLEDQQALQSLATQAAVAIQNARLFEQAQRRAWLLDTAAKVARDATATLEINELLADTARLIADRFHFFYHTGIFLLDKTREYAVLEASYPQTGYGMLTVGHKLRVGQEGIVGFVTHTGKLHLAPDVAQDPYHLYNPNLPDTRAEMVFPLIARGQVIGALDAQSFVTITLPEEDIATLQTLADQLANAILNAKLFRETAGQLQELKHTKGLVGARTALAWMGMVSAAWRHAIEGHALTILEEIDHLQAELPQSPLNAVEQRLFKVKKLAQLILDKPITPPLSKEEGVESVAINALLRERVMQLWANEPYRFVRRRLYLRLDDAATVRASPEWLRRLFDHLVDNAVEAMSKQPHRALTISTQRVGTSVEVTFADKGPGIPAEVLAELFHDMVTKPKGTKGLGTGLLMAQTIAHTYDGDVRVGTTSPRGTKMIVTLPIESQPERKAA